MPETTPARAGDEAAAYGAAIGPYLKEAFAAPSGTKGDDLPATARLRAAFEAYAEARRRD